MKNKFTSRRRFFFLVPVILVFGLSALVMWLWNAILPDLINVNSITYWQALGILLLSKILFGGFSGCGGHRHFTHKRHFINEMRKMKDMTPEEREKFKTAWKQHFRNSRCSEKN
ncbi:MAG: hypothetical protein KDC69_06750 [Flavobacteriaceae bacterium]|nr:hypothetical protein [Flavobacteriaceae bacterium]MCB0475355.1 hypothetical protein [Flavobacteriaceae bacterium]